MIGYLEGSLFFREAGYAIVLVQGMGYAVHVPERMLQTLTLKAPIALWIHEVIREDVHELYGFDHRKEMDIFKLLLKAPQVGPKLALSILDALPPASLAELAEQNDIRALLCVRGLGNKIAHRLLLELKTWSAQGLLDDFSTHTLASHHEEAVQCLMNLGYRELEVRRVVKDIHESSLESVIRQALKTLSKLEPAS